MKNVKIASAAVLLCVLQGAGAHTLHGAASPIMGILQSELQRNMQVLKGQDVPAYFGAYTVYDERSTQIVASFGAVERSDENHERFATVEVRVGSEIPGDSVAGIAENREAIEYLRWRTYLLARRTRPKKSWPVSVRSKITETVQQPVTPAEPAELLAAE